jgi:hypothetical protein
VNKCKPLPVAETPRMTFLAFCSMANDFAVGSCRSLGLGLRAALGVSPLPPSPPRPPSRRVSCTMSSLSGTECQVRRTREDSREWQLDRGRDLERGRVWKRDRERHRG